MCVVSLKCRRRCTESLVVCNLSAPPEKETDGPPWGAPTSPHPIPPQSSVCGSAHQLHQWWQSLVPRLRPHPRKCCRCNRGRPLPNLVPKQSWPGTLQWYAQQKASGRNVRERSWTFNHQWVLIREASALVRGESLSSAGICLSETPTVMRTGSVLTAPVSGKDHGGLEHTLHTRRLKILQTSAGWQLDLWHKAGLCWNHCGSRTALRSLSCFFFFPTFFPTSYFLL